MIIYPVFIRPAESLHDDVEAREALGSLLTGCYSDALFCHDPFTDHCVSVSDGEPCIALLRHSFGGLCATQVRVIYRLDNELLSALTYRSMSLDVFHLCSISIGLDPSAYGRKLERKLDVKGKRQHLCDSVASKSRGPQCAPPVVRR